MDWNCISLCVSERLCELRKDCPPLQPNPPVRLWNRGLSPDLCIRRGGTQDGGEECKRQTNISPVLLLPPLLICLTFCHENLRTVLLVLWTLKHLVNVRDSSMLSVKSDRHIVIRSSTTEDRKVQKRRSAFFSQRHVILICFSSCPSLKLEHVTPFSPSIRTMCSGLTRLKWRTAKERVRMILATTRRLCLSVR